MFPLALHFLYPIKSLLVNDSLMSILYQVHIQLPIVFDLLSGQEIRRISFLHQYLPHIFLVIQHSVDGGGAPLPLPCHCFDPVFFQVAFDLPYTVPLHIEIKYLPYDFRLLWDHLQYTVRSFCIAKKLRMVQHCFSTFHPSLQPELDIVAFVLVFCLIKGGI